MTGKIYYTSSLPNMVNKSLSLKLDIDSLILKNETSLLNPTFTLTGVSDVSDVSTWNYLYIVQFNRYYFIEDIIFDTGKLIHLKCRVDVLMSFKSKILSSSQIISRQENLQNKYIVDSKLPTHSDVSITCTPFGNSFDTTSETFILKTIGGL